MSSNHAVDDLAAQAAAGVPSRDISAKGGGILLMEDDADVRESLAAQLNSLGYEVLKTENEVNALAALDDGARIDLLFTGVGMPGNLSGLELAR